MKHAVFAMKTLTLSSGFRNGQDVQSPEEPEGMDVEWIISGLRRSGKTQRGLAQALGRDAAAVNRILKGKRQIKADEIRRIEEYLGTKAPNDGALRNNTDDQRNAVKIASINSHIFPRNIPVFGIAAAGAQDNIPADLNTGEVVDYVKRPPRLEGVNAAYGFYVVGDSMSPWREAGELIYVHPGQPCSIGDYVVVELIPKAETDGVPVLVKRLVRRTEKELRLLQYNPRKEITVPMSKVRAIHKVMGWTEMMGS